MGISMNGPSGIDTTYIIDSLVNLERNTRIKPLEKLKSAYQLKIDAYSKLQSHLSEVASQASKLKSASDFDVFKVTNSDESIARIEAGVGAVPTKFDLTVFSVAKSEKMISANNLITSQTQSLENFGISSGVIKIGGIEISVDATKDTIQDLRRKINNAKDSKGLSIGVSASVLKISDTNYRLVITSKESGGAGVEYEDVSGTVLQNLGILDANGQKGNTFQTLSSEVNIESAFASLPENSVIKWSGTDHNGNQISATFVKTASSTFSNFLETFASSYNSMVSVEADANGKLIITDEIAGTSKLSLSSFIMGDTSYNFGILSVGREGKGVLTAGSDAFFNIDGLNMRSSKNSVSGYIAGVTLTLQKADFSKTINVNLERDSQAVAKKVKDLLNAYNGLVRFVGSSTKFADPEDKNSKKGDLAGDMTAAGIVSQVKSAIQTEFNLFGGTYTNLSMIGVKTNPNNGELSLDENRFTTALENNLDEVIRLFVSRGVTDNPAIEFGRYNKNTKSGIYILEEVDSTHYQIRPKDGSTWYLSTARTGSVISFSEGPASGMSLSAPTGSGNAKVTFSKGLSDILDELINALTDQRDGLVAARQNSWQQSIRNTSERIDKLEQRIESYKARLVNQFSAMEKNLSQLQGQSGNMLSALKIYKR